MTTAAEQRAQFDAQTIGTREALLGYIRERFFCMDGPPRAYFEISSIGNSGSFMARCVYSVIRRWAYVPMGSDPLLVIPAIDAQARLVIDEIAAKVPGAEIATDRLLWWRRQPEYTLEMGPDDPDQWRVVLYMRLYVSGVDLRPWEYSLEQPEQSQVIPVTSLAAPPGI